MNIFSAITSGLQAYHNLSGLNHPTKQQTSQEPTWEGMLWSVSNVDTRTTLQKLAPKISDVWSQIENSDIIKNIGHTLSPIANTFYWATAKPVVEQVQYTSKINTAKKPFQEQLSSLGLTSQKLDELWLSEEEKQQVKNVYDQIWVSLDPEPTQNKPEDLWVLWSLKEWAIGASRVGQYLPEIAGNIGGMVPGLLWEGAGLIGSAFWVEKQDNPVYQNLKAGQRATENIGKSIVAPWEVWLTEWQKSARRSGATTALTLPVGGGYLKWATGLWNLAARSGIVGAWIGSTAPIIEKGSETSVGDIVKGGIVWGTVGAAVPLVWWSVYKLWKWTINVVRPKTVDEKLMKTVWDVTDAIVNWKKVKVPVPEEWILTKISKPLRESNPKILTWRALTPSYAWKTPKQKIKSLWEMTDNVKNFYSQVRTWKMKWDISTLESAANTVINNLDSIWENIWKSVSKAEWTVSPSVWTMEDISKTLSSKIEARSWAYKTLQNFIEDTKDPLSLQDAFKAKKVYQAEIWKLIKSWDAGTDSYSSLVKGVQELSDNIDNIVEKSIWSKKFIELKNQYKLLKKIASDISSSAVVEWRRTPQTFIEQLWTLQAITEWVTNPLSTAKTLFAKEIWELNTRWWAWKELIKNYDKEAIKLFKK